MNRLGVAAVLVRPGVFGLEDLPPRNPLGEADRSSVARNPLPTPLLV